MKELNIEKLKELAKEATPGPWILTGDERYSTAYIEARVSRGVNQEVAACGVTESHGHGFANASLIAAANPSTVLQLIDALESQQKRIAELEAARIAYASEFQPNEDGEPDVGSIHQNIRALKQRIEQMEAAEPAVPARVNIADAPEGYFQKEKSAWKSGWNMCRAAMLNTKPQAAPVRELSDAEIEFPAGAIHNAVAFSNMLENIYDFDCQAGPLRNCYEWIELRRCIFALSEYADKCRSETSKAQVIDSNCDTDHVDAAARGQDAAQQPANTCSCNRVGFVPANVMHAIDEVEGCLELCEPEDQSAFATIKAYIMSASAKPAQDKERLDWVELQQVSLLRYGAPDGWSYRFERGPHSPWVHTGKGLREAIDTARAAQKGGE